MAVFANSHGFCEESAESKDQYFFTLLFFFFLKMSDVWGCVWASRLKPTLNQLNYGEYRKHILKVVNLKSVPYDQRFNMSMSECNYMWSQVMDSENHVRYVCSKYPSYLLLLPLQQQFQFIFNYSNIRTKINRNQIKSKNISSPTIVYLQEKEILTERLTKNIIQASFCQKVFKSND